MNADMEQIKQAILKEISNEEIIYADNKPEESSSKEQFYDEILTPREKEILQLVLSGLKNKEVARELFISVNTVEAHKENIKHKLKLQSISNFYNIR